MPNEALIVQLLEWIGEQPRGYAETAEAWRTSCPRLTIWEDALSEGLVERVAALSGNAAHVRVTEKGLGLIERARTSALAKVIIA